MRQERLSEFPKMDTCEKILLVEELWDEIASEESHVSVPESHKKELERRYNKYREDPGCLLSLEELKGNIEDRR